MGRCAVILYMEPQDATPTEPDSGPLGVDSFRFAVDVAQSIVYTLDSLDMSGTIGRAEIADASGVVKVLLTPDSPSVTATLPVGVYKASVYSGYVSTTSATLGWRPVYFYSVPVLQDQAAAASQIAALHFFSGTRCEACSLAGADLSDVALTMNVLSYTDLSEANLRGADLSVADLTGAALAGADLTFATLSWATWTDGRTCAEGSVGQCLATEPVGAPVAIQAAGVSTAAAAAGCPGKLMPGSARWCDLNDGTILDMTTGLAWLKNANCWGLITKGDADQKVALLGNGQCGLTDGSVGGEWRIPAADELRGLKTGPEFISTVSADSKENNSRGFINLVRDWYVSSTYYWQMICGVWLGLWDDFQIAVTAPQPAPSRRTSGSSGRTRPTWSSGTGTRAPRRTVSGTSSRTGRATSASTTGSASRPGATSPSRTTRGRTTQT